MTLDTTQGKSKFDRFATSYDDALSEGLSASGENKSYFARGRIHWLGQCLQRIGVPVQSVLDFGCGTGTATRFLVEEFGEISLVGVDVSAQSLAEAKRHYPSPRVSFSLLNEYMPDGTTDLTYCNGVFHHIPPAERVSAVRSIFRSLRPGGIFAFWENNPWNPGTRYVMSRIPFDRDAITLNAQESKRLLQEGGFEILRTDFLFIFPRCLKALRGVEPFLSKLPFGAQYQVLCRKPMS